MSAGRLETVTSHTTQDLENAADTRRGHAEKQIAAVIYLCLVSHSVFPMLFLQMIH